jgi:hypothetical protein
MWNDNVWGDPLTENPFASTPSKTIPLENPFAQSTPSLEQDPVIDDSNSAGPQAATSTASIPVENPFVPSSPLKESLPIENTVTEEVSQVIETERNQEVENVAQKTPTVFDTPLHPLEPFAPPVVEPMIPNPLFDPPAQQSWDRKSSFHSIDDNTPLGLLHQVQQGTEQFRRASLANSLHSSLEEVRTESQPRRTSRGSLSSIHEQKKRSSVAQLVLVDPLNALGIVEEHVPQEKKKEVVIDKPLPNLYQFESQVVDPLKVGDKLSGYVEYRIMTKTNNPQYRNSEFSVMRRYSDFLWLYNQLLNTNPGVIVPPVAEKMALGRFQDEFIESRKVQLDRFIKQVVGHPILQLDPSLRVFLESETFANDRKGLTNKSLLSSEVTPLSVQGFASNPDNHTLLEDKRQYLMNLETQIKGLSKTLESLLIQRKGNQELTRNG